MEDELTAIKNELSDFFFLLLSVSSIPKRVESTRPRCDFTLVGEEDEGAKPEYTSCDDRHQKELSKLLRRNMGSHELSKSDNLKQAKHACKSCM